MRGPVRSLQRLRAAVVLAGLLPAPGVGAETGSRLGEPAAAVEEAFDLQGERPLSSASYGVDDYLRLPVLAAPHAVPLSERELERELSAMWRDADRDLARGTLEEPVAPDDLQADLARALNIGFLLDGLDSRPLRVSILDDYPGDDAREQLLLFEDPLVGRFAGLLLLPTGPGPFPALVALPGHDRGPRDFCTEFQCERVVAAGYVVGVLQLRADESGELEHRVASFLLQQGFNLAGLHVYETLLFRRYLRTLASVDPQRIGLVGHSGGAVIANLAIHIHPGFSVLATDTTATFTEDMSGGLLCSSGPSLYPFHPLVSELSYGWTPSHLFEYGFPEGVDAVIRALDRSLQPERDPGSPEVERVAGDPSSGR